MSNLNEHLLTAIDVGSAKTCALVAEITDAGLRYRSHGIVDSLGSRKGMIVDLERAVGSIQRAVEEAENGIGAPIERAIVGIAGSHVRGVNSLGGISLGSRPRDRKSTRLNSSHSQISYAVFCLKKKNNRT